MKEKLTLDLRRPRQEREPQIIYVNGRKTVKDPDYGWMTQRDLEVVNERLDELRKE